MRPRGPGVSEPSPARGSGGTGLGTGAPSGPLRRPVPPAATGAAPRRPLSRRGPAARPAPGTTRKGRARGAGCAGGAAPGAPSLAACSPTRPRVRARPVVPRPGREQPRLPAARPPAPSRPARPGPAAPALRSGRRARPRGPGRAAEAQGRQRWTPGRGVPAPSPVRTKPKRPRLRQRAGSPRRGQVPDGAAGPAEPRLAAAWCAHVSPRRAVPGAGLGAEFTARL